MHAIIDTGTIGVGLYIWSVDRQAAVFIGKDDLEGDIAYLHGADVMKAIMSLAQVYNDIHDDRKCRVSFGLVGYED